jgi:hypothetical protein
MVATAGIGSVRRETSHHERVALLPIHLLPLVRGLDHHQRRHVHQPGPTTNCTARSSRFSGTELYGPSRPPGGRIAPSNVTFDTRLPAHDPGWRLRNLEGVVELAGAAEFALAEVVDIPANKLQR